METFGTRIQGSDVRNSDVESQTTLLSQPQLIRGGTLAIAQRWDSWPTAKIPTISRCLRPKDSTLQQLRSKTEVIMGALTAPELREFREQTPLQRAKSRNEEVIAICNHLVQAMHAWGRLGKLCHLVERDKDYLLLGFESFGQWMMKVEEVSGYSRASAYQYMKLFREL